MDEFPIIGVDFDNTIACYDHLFWGLAVERNLILPEIGKNKKSVRDAIRSLLGGEILWQELQAEIYGPRMGQACRSEGVGRFFEECRKRFVRTYIISHKTEFASHDSTGTSLRSASMRWLCQQGFFDSDGLAVERDHVYFESTRCEKIGRIKDLKCTHFIDDLEETFLEDSFPTDVIQILLDPHGLHKKMGSATICHSWDQVISVIFRTAG